MLPWSASKHGWWPSKAPESHGSPFFLLEEGALQVEDPDMRILRLDLSSGQSVDLHPFVTVLSGLDEASRVELQDAIRTIARGSTAGIRGLVQNQGLLVELDGLGHDRLSALTSANVIIDGERVGADTSWLQAEVDQQQRRAEIAAVMVEELRADIDPSARARVAAIEARLAPADDEQAKARIERIERVSTALAALTETEQLLVESPPGVAELQQALAANDVRLADADKHFGRLNHDIEQALEAVASARGNLEAAQAAAKPILLTREEEARLELLSYPATDDSRRGKWRKNLRREEKEEMNSLLRKVGVESYTAYTVYRASPTAPQERIDAEAAAAKKLAEMERQLRSAEHRRDEDSLYQELTATTKSLREQAREFLGMMLPADVVQALDALTVESENPDWHEAAHHLVSVLSECVDEPTHRASAEPNAIAEVEAAVARAEAWLATNRIDRGGEADVEELRRELDREKGVLDRHQRALGRIGRAEAAAVEAALGLAQLQEQLTAQAPERADSIDGLLASIEPIATQVRLEARGSLPIALIGGFAGLDDEDITILMPRLSELSEGLQIVVVTERTSVIDWVAQVGLDRAMVSRIRSRVADGVS